MTKAPGPYDVSYEQIGRTRYTANDLERDDNVRKNFRDMRIVPVKEEIGEPMGVRAMEAALLLYGFGRGKKAYVRGDAETLNIEKIFGVPPSEIQVTKELAHRASLDVVVPHRPRQMPTSNGTKPTLKPH